jgi:phthiocerol/phenolphthiocerol synthesis type-I polyketide synthase E
MDDQPHAVADTDIAVIGMALHVPKARTPEAFWQNLAKGVEAISFFDDETLLASGVEPSLVANPNFVPAGGVLDDVELFDASFFGFAAREAQIMDPQHRLFLECAWEALENAGYDSQSYDGLIGVYAGSTMNTYLLINLMTNRNVLEVVGDLQTMIGNDKEYLATRVSYKLGLTGPSYAVQTACSTSLVAVHVACQALLNGECEIALAGGSSVRLPHGQGYMYQPGGTSSPDGHCRAFDAKAAGSVVGSGAGIVVLKPLADALAEGDTVHAVIKGSAINNDGAAKASFTAPSIEGQANAVANAIAVSGVPADSITYLEAHGTGTLLGDPIEIAALTRGFRRTTDRTGFCQIGSVKTNIGHLDAAAGIAGFVKAVLCLEQKQLPPSLNFDEPNPKIDFESSPFRVNTELTPWETNGAPRRASVNSVGIGGTNAHVVLEEAPPPRPSGPSRPAQLLTLSARTPRALDALTERLAAHLRDRPELELADVAHTLHVGRRELAHRRFAVCRDRDEAVSALEGGRFQTAAPERTGPPVAFMFSGQGSQYPNMTRGLYEAEPAYRAALDECCDGLEPLLGLDLRSVLFPAEGAEEEAAERLAETRLTQPALFAVEYALAQLWTEWGVQPKAMIGHSIGEYVAACLAGVFSLSDAFRLVAERGRIVQEQPRGAMLSIALAESELAPLLDGEVSLSAVNAPALCAVGGSAEAVEAFEARLREHGVAARRLVVSHGFHSAAMDGAVGPLEELMQTIELSPPELPFVSNATGDWITDEQATSPVYWAEHVRHPVRFHEGVRTLLDDEARVLLEVGPGTVLATLVRQDERAAGRTVVATTRHPQQGDADDEAVALDALGKLWLGGAAVDWNGFAANERRRRVPLPTYPFERQRLWIDPRREDAARLAPTVVDAAPEQPAEGAPAPAPGPVERAADPTGWLWSPAWRRTAPLVARSDGAVAQRVLLFADESELSSRLAARLGSQGRSVLVVRGGDAFERLGERTYVIRPEVQEDYEQLFADLRSRDKSFDAIVHTWGLEPEDVRDDPAAFERLQVRGAASLTALARAVGSQRVTCDLRFVVVANNAYEVTGAERLLPANALVAGPALVVPQEYSNVSSRIVDLDLGGAVERDVAQLAAELDGDGTERVVALRGGHRWVRGVDALGAGGGPPRLVEGGVYLVVGGLGDLGFTFASYFADALGARLVLVDTAVPEEDGADTRAAQRLRTLRRLGAEVLAIRADASDSAELEAAVTSAVERFGRIDGVVHAAGVSEHEAVKAVHETTIDELRRHFPTKVTGLAALDAALSGTDVGVVLLMSSLSTFLGGLGTAAYTAACAFMDAFAHERRREGRSWTSVGWDTWKPVDAAGDGGVVGDLRARLALSADEGVEALRRILSAPPVAQVLVSTAPLAARVGEAPPPVAARADGAGAEPPAQLPAEEAAEPPPAAAVGAAPRPELATPYNAPRDDLERKVAEIWQDLIGIDRVGVDDNFFELGGHSLLATQLITRLRETFETDLPLASLFDAPTVATLAALLRDSPAGGNGAAEPPAGDDEIEDILRELEQLPREEIDSRLAELEREGGLR